MKTYFLQKILLVSMLGVSAAFSTSWLDNGATVQTVPANNIQAKK